MNRVDVPAIDDSLAVIEQLEGMWLVDPPVTYKGHPLKPIIGSEYDQEPVGDNPYWDVVRRMPLDSMYSHYLGSGHALQVEGWVSRTSRDYVVTRERLTTTYAWAIPTPGDIRWITSKLEGRGVLEIGAGTGYWAWQLSQAGVDVVAVDEFPGAENTFCGPTQYHQVLQGGPRTARYNADRALMLCWPPYGSAMAEESLEHYAGDLVIYVGEPRYGCNAGDGFFERLAAEWDSIGSSPQHVTFGGIHCYVEVYMRRTAEATTP